MTIEAQFKLAVQCLQNGRMPEAQRLLGEVLSRAPDHFDALNAMGMIASMAGRYDSAADWFSRALSINDRVAPVHGNLGTALQRLGRTDAAIAAYRRAIALDPRLVAGYANLGVVLLQCGRIDESIAASRRAIELDPRQATSYVALGSALRQSPNAADAIAAYRMAIELRPDLAEAHNNLGVALAAEGCPDEALACYRRAISLQANYVDAHINLAILLLEHNHLPDAIAAARRAIAADSNAANAWHILGNALRLGDRLDEALSAYRRAVALRPESAAAHSSLLYALYFDPASDARVIADEHRRWNQQHAELLKAFIRPHANDRDPTRRLRIGYVSPDFRLHPVGRFLLPLFAHHDHGNFETFAYDDAPKRAADDITARLRGTTDHWRSIDGLSDTRAADLIRADHIDILVDLTLHMAQSRLLIFAARPAPVQVTYLAYAGTSGLTTIDYRLSDPYLDPPDGDETIYSEKTLRLPDTYWCYEPVTSLPPVGPPAMETGSITFGCLGTFCKVNRSVLAAWARLLGAAPDARLLLHSHQGAHRQQTLAFFHGEGIDPSRISFVPKMPTSAYFEVYQSVDIILDTFPYGGGTTTCDALWMGVPVVTLAGQTAVGRGGVSILSNLGLHDWIARTPDEYIARAAALAGDVPRLAALRTSLRRRMTDSPLMDAARFTRAIEAIYRSIWIRWCDTPPADRQNLMSPRA